MQLSRKSRSASEFTGFLDQGTSLTGELSFSGALRVDGDIHGSISTTDLLIVGERATIHADIKAGEVRIHGTVFGNVESERKVEIFATGSLRGDVSTPLLVIEEGGVLEGSSRNTSEIERPAAEWTASSSSRLLDSSPARSGTGNDRSDHDM